MSRFNAPCKRDKCHAGVVKTLETIGCKVVDISQASTGADILIGYRGHWVPCEIKTGKKKMTETEKDLCEDSLRRGLPYWIIRDNDFEQINNLMRTLE